MLMVAGPILGDEEKSALSSVLDGGWITMGERVREFEREFASVQGAADAVAVSSCTAALHLIMVALGIGPGDEVLVPSLTFVATANCVLHVGATPVFVDIEALDRPVMSRTDAAQKCNERTRAVILVHYAGYVLDGQVWRDFARTRGLLLIEDAAHAAGAIGAGTFSVAAAFSFYGNKNMTTAEGGIIISKSADLLGRVRNLRSHGMTTATFQRALSRDARYDVTELGFNYRMDELRAAIGLAQLRRLGVWNDKREKLTRLYVEAFIGLGQSICIPFLRDISERASSAYHIMPVVLPAHVDRQAVTARLRSAQVQTTIHYPPVHSLSLYRNRFGTPSLPVTNAFAERELTVPLHPRMEPEHVKQVATALQTALLQAEF